MIKSLTKISGVGLIFLATGCSTNELGNALYDPVVVTNTVPTLEGTRTIVTTNGWVLNPDVRAGIHAVGAVAPFPWASLAATFLVGVLGIGSHVRSRQWRKAAVSGISAAQKFKSELQKLDAQKAREVKSEAKTEQKMNKTETLEQSVLNDIN